jgi:hypothetical protein
VQQYDDFALKMKIRYEPVVDTEDFSLPDEAFLDQSGKEDIREDTSCTIKIGGTPVFLQTPQRVKCPKCRGPVAFLAQIGSELEDPGWGGYSLELAGGELFVFKCRAECCPDGTAMYLQLD